MLNAAAATATAAARHQQRPQQFGVPSSSSTATPPSSSSSHHITISPTSHHQQLLQAQVANKTNASNLKAETLQANAYSPMTVGALLKMQNNGSGGASVADGNMAGNGMGNTTVMASMATKNGQTLNPMTSAALSGSSSPTGHSDPLVHHLQDPATKYGSPSPHHSPDPRAPSVASSSFTSKRPAPIQIGPGANRLIDDTVGGVAAPTTPASPYTGQQGQYYTTTPTH